MANDAYGQDTRDFGPPNPRVPAQRWFVKANTRIPFWLGFGRC